MPHPQAPRRRRPLLIALGLALIGVVLALLLADVGWIVRPRLLRQLQAAEARTGRHFEIGGVSLHLLPPSTEIRHLRIDAQPGQQGAAALPLLTVRSLRARLALWPLLRSLGQDLDITAVLIDEAVVTLVRPADGPLSIADLLTRLREGKKPLTPEQLARLRRVSLRQFSLNQASLRLYDSAAAPEPRAVLSEINVEVSGARLGAPFPVTLDAAVAAAQRNLHLEMTVAVPEDLVVPRPALLLRRASLRLQPLDLAPLLPLIRSSLRGGLLSGEVHIETPAAAGQLRLRTQLRAQRLLIGSDGTAGQPLDAGLRAELGFDPLAGAIQAPLLEVTLGEARVRGSADLRDLWRSPSVHGLSLTSEGLLLERVLSFVPPGSLPRQAELSGPLSLTARATGTPQAARVEAAADLSAATVRLPYLDKPPGMPLSATLSAQLSAGGAAIDRLGVVLGPLSLLLTGTVRSADDLDLKIDSGEVPFDKVLRLLPQVRRAVPEGTRMKGALQVAGSLRRKGEAIDASAHVAVRGAGVAVPALRLGGGATIEARVRGDASQLTMSGTVDLAGAAVTVPEQVDKPQGVPMDVALEVERRGQRLVVRRAQLRLPGGTVTASGHVDRRQVDITVPRAELDLQRLGKVLPALRRKVPALGGGKLRLALQAGGDPRALGTVQVKVTEFDYSGPAGKIAGTATLVGLDTPRDITFDLQGERLDLDGLVAQGDGGEAPRREPGLPSLPKGLKLDGKLRLGSGRLRGVPLRDVELAVTLHRDVLRLGTLRARALSGMVTLSGTSLDLSARTPRYEVRALFDDIELSELAALRKGAADQPKVRGRARCELKVRGAGLSWAEASRRLDGDLSLALRDVHLQGNPLRAKVVNPLLGKLMLKRQEAPQEPRQLDLRELSARFSIARGHLRTAAPLRFSATEGDMSLSGAIALSGRLSLEGTLQVSPALIAEASKGRLAPDKPVPVRLRLGGTLAAPEIEILEPGKTAAALLRAGARGRMQGQQEVRPVRDAIRKRIEERRLRKGFLRSR